MTDQREFNLRVKVSAVPWDKATRPPRPRQECDTHEFMGYDEDEVKIPQPLGEWMVTTETGEWSSKDRWLVVDQAMCTECLDLMQDHEVTR